jgi:branched-chain amino acid transport system substrate-binding protein
MVSDSSVVAAIGPQMSGSGKAMSPILSQGNLAIITPASTNPDITDPKYAGQYRPAGKAIYFRTVTTDAFQGPNMANYFADTLKVKSLYVLDDSGAYGVGIADAFQRQAEKRGIKVLGRDQLNPKEADYATVLTKIKSMNPDALYYGGVAQAGVKLVGQSFDILPKMIKGGGDGTYGAEIPRGGGFPAAEGWYATIAAPNILRTRGSTGHRALPRNSGSNLRITRSPPTMRAIIIDAIKVWRLPAKRSRVRRCETPYRPDMSRPSR